MAINGLAVHQVAHLQNSGLSTAESAVVIAAFSLSFLLGRLPYTVWGDRFSKQRILLGVFILYGIGLMAIGFADQLWPIAIFIACLGIGHGAITPLRPAAFAEYFGTRAFASISGLSDMAVVVGGILGPIIMGLAFDWTGEYQGAIFLLAALLIITIPAFLLLGKAPYRKKSG